MELAQDRDSWWALVSTVRNLRVPKMQGISWLAVEPVSFSRRTLLPGVSKLYTFDNKIETLFKMVSQKVPLTNIGIRMPAGKALGLRKNLKILLIISEFMDDFHTARGASCTMNLSNVSQEEDCLGTSH